MNDSIAMTQSTPTVTRRLRVSRFPGVVCIVALTTLAPLGCGRRTYPTISAHNPDGGSVNVHGTYNHCPVVYFSASPDHVSVGPAIALSASASDAEHDALTYAWSATGGMIDRPDAAMTTFHCTARGAVVITLAVGDGACDTPASGEVLCQSEDAAAPDG